MFIDFKLSLIIFFDCLSILGKLFLEDLFNNESKDESFELEENKENERLFQEFISCPKTRVFIYFSLISFFTFNFIDAILIAFRLFKDNNGEELYIN